MLVHAHHKYSNEEEWGWVAKQSDWPNLNGWYSAPGSSTGVPVFYCTLTAPGAHSPYIQKVKVNGEVILLQARCGPKGG